MSKRIEKIKNYNQIILAIAGTIGILLLLFSSFFILEDLSRSFFRESNDNTNGILAIEETDQLRKDSLRKQIISFNKIQIIDSASQTFIIPVTQANLADAEKDNDILQILNTKSIGKSYDRFYGNIYNNLVIYNRSTGKSKIIFDRRISIEDFLIHETNNKKFIIIPGCNIDSNKDGYLNEKDLQELFIFDIQTNQLHKIKAQENYTTLRSYQPTMSNDLIVHFGIDRNKNGVFDSSTEPMVFYRLNFEEMKIEKFIDNEQLNKLQKLLEGK